MTVYWSKTAEKNYLKVIDYLIRHWTKKEVISLDNKVNKLVHNIVSFKTICPPSKKINLHKCVVDGNNSLVYQIKSNKLFIIDFIPHKKNITRY